MNLKWFFTLLALTKSFFCIGQSDTIINHFPDSLIKGIYWSYHDLLKNRPYYTDTFNILYANNARQYAHRFPEWQEFYSVNVDRVAYHKKGKFVFSDAGEFFGYSDGKVAYISLKRFHPINIFGPICLVHMVEQGSKSDYGMAGLAGGLIGLGIAAAIDQGGGMGKVDDWFVLDLYTGHFDPIDPMYLNPIFRQHDKELYKEFKSVKKRRKLETMIEFVLRFNDRNQMPRE